MVLVNKINTDSVERFFLAPIWLYGNKACFSAVSAICSTITLSKILLRVFSKCYGPSATNVLVTKAGLVGTDQRDRKG